MNVEDHIELIDERISKGRRGIPAYLIADIRNDIILRLLTYPKPGKKYTDKSWVTIVSNGILTNFRKREDKYHKITSSKIDIDSVYKYTPCIDHREDLMLSIELHCNEIEIRVAKMIKKGHTYKKIAEILGKTPIFVSRVNESIKNKLKENKTI